MTMPRYEALAFSVLLCVVSNASGAAGCDHSATDAERIICLGAELRSSDQAINDTYSSAMKMLDDQDRASLRRKQLAWMNQRDLICQLHSHTKDREVWYQEILQDYYKTVCVTRFTKAREREIKLESRISYLESRIGDAMPEATPQSPPRQSNESLSRGQGRPVYDVHGSQARRQGKWYFEVKLKIADMARSVDAVMFVGVLNTNGENSGTLIKVRPEAQTLGISLYPADKTVGIAVDLDNGKLYIRENGMWRQGMPGSAGGLNLKLGRDYHPLVSSSVRLNSFLEQKLLEINFGVNGFSYSLPDGYAPYSTTSAGY